MSVLEKIKGPSDVKGLSPKELNTLATELRQEIISVIDKNGGHLSSNLGIVEATVALYRTFDFPKDKLVFDVGHQCYPHKILSGRRDSFDTIRTDGGLSGFPDIGESEYDPFTTGHAGTAIAAGLGLCAARDKAGEDYCVINVVGDGALVNGLNLEAITSSDTKPKNYIVILNDNGMSISKNRNGFYRFISKSTTKRGYVKSKTLFKKVFGNSFITRFFRKIRGLVKRIFNGENYFEKFGFKYVGVCDGNDLKELTEIFARVKEACKEKAIFLHIKTTKGKGLKEAEERADLYHGVGKNMKHGGGAFSETLGNAVNREIEKDGRIVAVTAAMKDGTGLSVVEEAHPDNFFDVGIAEEFAVTFAAGMARGGLKPIVAVYSTFLQRAYDEILHDVCLQGLHVVFCLDRAGLVGADGKTHQGVFDISYLNHLPYMTILAPSDKEELCAALSYALSLNNPVAIRYPKDSPEFVYESKPFGSDMWVTVKEGEKAAIFAVGPRMIAAALEGVNKSGVEAAVISARFVKPLDTRTLDKYAGREIITMEENAAIGGFGSSVAAYYSDNDAATKVTVLGVKDRFVGHGSVASQLKANGLTAEDVADILTNKFAK